VLGKCSNCGTDPTHPGGALLFTHKHTGLPLCEGCHIILGNDLPDLPPGKVYGSPPMLPLEFLSHPHAIYPKGSSAGLSASDREIQKIGKRWIKRLLVLRTA